MTHNWPDDAGEPPDDETTEERDRRVRQWVAFGTLMLIFWIVVVYFLLEVSGKL